MDESIEALELERDKLMERVLELRDQLTTKKADKTKFNTKSLPRRNGLCDFYETRSTENSVNEKELSLLVEATENANGISYKRISRKWLRDDLWLYTTHVEMKVLSFRLDLTMCQKDGCNTVEDIHCHFENKTDASIFEEISPWVKTMTKEKNFSYLMSAFSEYNNQCQIRQKILATLEDKRYASTEQCSKKGGGFTVLVHKPTAPTEPYAEYRWQIDFNPKTRAMDHVFNISCLDDGFVEKYKDIFKDFCKSGIKTADLEQLWIDLCSALEEY